MAFTVSSTKSTSGRREGKMNGQEITEVTTFLTSEFRHGPCRFRPDESGTGRELAPWLQDSPPRLWKWERTVDRLVLVFPWDSVLF